MKYSMEIYTQLIKSLQDLNQEIRQRHSSMHSCTEQEMQSLEAWLVEIKKMAQDLDNCSLIINHHLNILEIELRERQREDISKQ